MRYIESIQLKLAELMNDAVCGFYDIYCGCIASLLSIILQILT